MSKVLKFGDNGTEICPQEFKDADYSNIQVGSIKSFDFCKDCKFKISSDNSTLEFKMYKGE